MRSHDLIIIGTGSGNSILTPDFDDWDVAIVEKGVFGGTCLNVGCIPSKMFVYAAEQAEHAKHNERFGITTSFGGADWPAIRDRVFGRIDPIAAGGRDYRHSLDNVTVYEGEGRFTGPKQLTVDGQTLTAEQIVLAAGARVFVPDVPGLADVPFYTSDTIMRIDPFPERLVVLGGGFIACELGHVFGGLGSEVTIINRSDTLLRAEDDEIRMRFTEIYRSRFDLLLSTQVLSASMDGDEVVLDVSVDGDHREVRADALLVATGRVPNADTLNVTACGVEVDPHGYVVSDAFQRTNVGGVWALGDITNDLQLKHVANAEARVVAHNLANPNDLRSADLRHVPHAVFGHPQVASVGLTERAARAAGIPYVVAHQHYGDVAYGWAMEDTESFAKLLADPDTRLLVGAHIIGPQAATLLQQLVQAMSFGQTVDEIAHGQIWTHPALPELLENALLQF